MNAALADYSLLGTSGLRVSPFCLGAMTFGSREGWGCPDKTAGAIVGRFLDSGGNFIDTADNYSRGASEALLGRILRRGGRRDRVVLATKFTFSSRSGDPNAGGNGRKNILRAVEASLRRLRTDYIDLYWLHAWDMLTPVEEVLSTLDSLTRSGKVRAIGFSDTPAWYLARAQTMAEWRGWEKVCALQLEYSLAERNVEREHIPAALHLGMAVCPWAPLANGLLTGKYRPSQADKLTARATSGRMSGQRFPESSWKVLKILLVVSGALRRPPAQVALNWLSRRPGVTSTLLGVTSLRQLDENLGALDFEIPPELLRPLDDVGRPAAVFPYRFFTPGAQDAVTGGTAVRARRG